MSEQKQKNDQKVPFQFIIDIFKWLLEINFKRYGRKGESL